MNEEECKTPDPNVVHETQKLSLVIRNHVAQETLLG